jgi:homoserine O-acetyltransferase/O-succinyltransferase
MADQTTTSKPKARKIPDDPPDSPRSVGWTEAQVLQVVGPHESLLLEKGGQLRSVDVEFETYGRLSAAKDNVVLICHALSGDAHVAGWDKNAEKAGRAYRLKHPGWWDTVIGPGKAIDTNRYFVICANCLGSCYGTTGPACINPDTGKPYAMNFPVVTVGDWVKVQALLLDKLGIPKVRAVLGGSLGGQQALEWALAYPERVERAVIFAAAHRLSTQGVAFNAVGRQAIMTDPDFNAGNYYDLKAPDHGLAVARMMAHITYLSEEGMHQKFGRRLRQENSSPSALGGEFEVESYLNYKGRAFVERFDANSYLYITWAMNHYDAAARWGSGDLVEACKRLQSRVLVCSFSSDWLYTPQQSRELAFAMCRAGKAVSYVEVKSNYGHDSFLVETEAVSKLLDSFLAGGAR